MAASWASRRDCHPWSYTHRRTGAASRSKAWLAAGGPLETEGGELIVGAAAWTQYRNWRKRMAPVCVVSKRLKV